MISNAVKWIGKQVQRAWNFTRGLGVQTAGLTKAIWSRFKQAIIAILVTVGIIGGVTTMVNAPVDVPTATVQSVKWFEDIAAMGYVRVVDSSGVQLCELASTGDVDCINASFSGNITMETDGAWIGNNGIAPLISFNTNGSGVITQTVTGGRCALLGNAASPTILCGYSGNTSSGTGNTVSGGGYAAHENTASGDYSTISGGHDNSTTIAYGTIGGGFENSAAGAAVVAGGASNSADGFYSTIPGGEFNQTTGGWAFSTGMQNVAGGDYAAIVGGFSNETNARGAIVLGGNDNNADGQYSLASGNCAKANHQGSFVWADSTAADFASTGQDEFSARTTGGFRLCTTSDCSEGVLATTAGLGTITETVAGGGCRIIGDASVATIICGSLANSGPHTGVAIGGGSGHQATSFYAAIGGGLDNDASAAATVSGGSDNTASAFFSAVSGGETNTASATHTAVGGGYGNTASATYTAIGGGHSNTASSTYSAIGGGFSNSASGDASIIPGGADCDAAGDYSLAVGRRAKANNQGCFVWGDSTNSDVTCSNNNRTIFRSAGGYYIYTNAGLTSGMFLAAGGSAWNAVSDRDAKEAFNTLDGDELLDRIAAMPTVESWQYRDQEGDILHVGAMADDFNSLVDGLGGEGQDRINQGDAIGINLAAIQALTRKVDALERGGTMTSSEAYTLLLTQPHIVVSASILLTGIMTTTAIVATRRRR